MTITDEMVERGADVLQAKIAIRYTREFLEKLARATLEAALRGAKDE